MEKLTLRGWALNSVRIINALKGVVTENKGCVVETAPFTKHDPKIIAFENGGFTSEIVVTHLRQLDFEYNGNFYMVSLDRNPFFDGVYVKEAIRENTISAGAEGKTFSLESWFVGENPYEYLSEEEIKAFRIADNRVSEFATWDYDKLDLELEDLSEMNVDIADF